MVRRKIFQFEMGPSGKIEARRLSKAVGKVINQFFVNILKPESELTDFRVMGESVQTTTSAMVRKSGIWGNLLSFGNS